LVNDKNRRKQKNNCHPAHSELQLQLGGGAVPRRKSAIGNVEAVLVSVDEVRRNYVPFALPPREVRT
jgi:hypothetical protein